MSVQKIVFQCAQCTENIILVGSMCVALDFLEIMHVHDRSHSAEFV